MIQASDRQHSPLFDWGESQIQYPARRSDPVSSFLAAESINPTPLQARILEVLRQHPEGLTTEEIWRELVKHQPGLTHITVSPRLKPMEKSGLVERTGQYRLNVSRRSATIWRIRQRETT